MMVPQRRNNLDAQLVNQDQSQTNAKSLLGLLHLSIEWNSLEGVKEVLKDIKKQSIQVSLFSSILS